MKIPDLTFKVAPHAIEDLGSNLYTSLPKVLAEFVANAYDADATEVNISYDFKKVSGMRRVLRKNHEAEKEEGGVPTPLASERLGDEIAVTIEDNGFGMTPDELNDRFLFAGRKRRQLKSLPRTTSRPLMGRKGLGKLAGFGVAELVQVTSKRKGDRALKVTLDYNEILKEDALSRVKVPSEWSDDIDGDSGTTIRLSRLGFESTKSQEETIRKELSEHFEFVDPNDFCIKLNGEQILPPNHKFKFAWPRQDGLSDDDLVSEEIETELGKFSFDWRMRFRGDRDSLSASKRGVRIYANNRMAASPSLLSADTNMHGFRMTDYLDGIVRADFIDAQVQDYISTDRQSLKWETPLLAPLEKFLSDQIKVACRHYQQERDKAKSDEVMEDPFTKKAIENGGLSKRETTIVKQVAVKLASYLHQGTNDPQYKTVLPEVIGAIGHGNLYGKLIELSSSEGPAMHDLLSEVVKLNRAELDRTTMITRSRLVAIETLENEIDKLTKSGEPRNENDLQKLFEEAPWLLDQRYGTYVTADKPNTEVIRKLADHLKIRTPKVPSDVAARGRKEPDFVFLIGNAPLQELVIIELKASTKEGGGEDIRQLRRYMMDAENFLDANGHERVLVRGELVCSPPPKDGKSDSSRDYWVAMKDWTPSSDWRVRPYLQVLGETKTAHQFLLEVASSIEESEADS